MLTTITLLLLKPWIHSARSMVIILFDVYIKIHPMITKIQLTINEIFLPIFCIMIGVKILGRSAKPLTAPEINGFYK